MQKEGMRKSDLEDVVDSTWSGLCVGADRRIRCALYFAALAWASDWNEFEWLSGADGSEA